MKILSIFIIATIALRLAASCKKTGTDAGNAVIYEETIRGIQKNEPVLLTFKGNGNNQVIWTVHNKSIFSSWNQTISLEYAVVFEMDAEVGTS